MGDEELVVPQPGNRNFRFRFAPGARIEGVLRERSSDQGVVELLVAGMAGSTVEAPLEFIAPKI